MSDTFCTYPGNRRETLVAYLYDDIDPAERAAFEVHAAACTVCRDELAGLGVVRTELALWSPPDRASSPGGEPEREAPPRGWHMLGAIPAWAQVAAALLFVGIAAGIANLDVKYDREGLSVRTGWSRSAPAPAPVDVVVAQPWRADLAALEQQIRTEINAAVPVKNAPIPVVSKTGAAADAEILRRMTALLEESERRQQRELALRVAEAFREVQAQRQADLVKIDRTLGLMQNNTGIEVMRNREMLNSLAVRVSQKP